MEPFKTQQRRDFLKTGALATTGMLIGTPSIVRASTLRTPSDEIRVGFIGCGKQHQVLFNTMKNLSGVRFVTACDIMFADRLQWTVGQIRGMTGERPPFYTDAEEMLAKEAKNLDAVFVASPDFWHAPHTVMALEAGLHVYCEKMMSDTIDGARSMVEASERTGKFCQIGHQRRSNPRYLFVLNELLRKQNLCGQIVNVNGQWNRSLTASQDIEHGKPHQLPPAKVLRRYGFDRGATRSLSEEALRHRFENWRFYKALSGGPISDLGAHQIDVLNWFLGSQPKSVMASGGRSHFKSREHFDNVMCVLDYDTPQGDTRAFYQVLTTTSAGGGYFESFMGTDGTIAISEREDYTNIYKESGASSTKWDQLVKRGYLRKSNGGAPSSTTGDAIAAYASAPPEKYELPGGLGVVSDGKGGIKTKSPYAAHILNFFEAIRGNAELNCDARHAFETEAPVYWINEAAESKSTIHFTEDHLKA